VVAGARFGGWGAEVELFAAAGSYLRESALDRQLEALVPGIRRSAFLDVFGAALVGEWGVPAPGRGEGPRGGPALRAGVELRRAVLREVHYDSAGTFQVTLLREVDALDVGPVLGAGVDLWLGGGGRLRVCAVDRARLRRLAPTAPRRWDHELVLLLDLIVSPGSF
jgi:hypothetical protein